MKEHYLKAENERGKGKDMQAERFEEMRKELVKEHQGELNQLRTQIANKERDQHSMEQLLLKMNHQVEQANSEKEEIKIEADMAKIDKIRLEERVNYSKTQFDELNQRVKTLADESD